MPRFDAVIVGAGPAGSTAALCLARAGARVALVDGRTFPRDKACGDLIGPRGVRLLDDLKIVVPGAKTLGDMRIVGPSGHSALLPTFAGADYPGHALAMRRRDFDAVLYRAAVEAGASPVHARVTGLVGEPDAVTGVELARAGRLDADVVVGADGAISQVAASAGLVDEQRALWGFALRGYFDVPLDLPHILFWEPDRWRLFPGYGWIFPSADGGTNVGLGLAVGADRGRARAAGERFAAFLGYLAEHGLLPHERESGGRLGGWLKMGQVGTVPGRGNVLLVGDAAGLINPLQGEGIAPAMVSATVAAAAIVDAGPTLAADRYLTALHDINAHHRVNAPVQAGLVRHPLAASLAGRVLTAPLVRSAMAGAWGLYWNDLVRGARPSHHRNIALALTRLVAAGSSRGEIGAWFDHAA